MSSVFFPLLTPQLEHICDEGYHLSILTTCLSFQSALYCNLDTNIDQDTSLIDLSILLLRNIPFVFKSSIQITSWFLTMIVLTLFKKSSRWLATFSCNLATLIFCF